MSTRLTSAWLVPLIVGATFAAGLIAASPAHAAKGFTGVDNPTIAGAKAVGNTVTAKRDTTTTPTATTVTYRWLRNGDSISKATKSAYTVTATDKGKKLSVKVCYKKSKYTSKCVTSVSGTVAAGTLTAATPTISGAAIVGVTQTAKPGTWTSSTTLKYQWLRDSQAITGAASPTYKLTSADKGHKMSVAVTGSKSGYSTTSKTSNQTGAVEAAMTLSQEQAVRMAQSYIKYSAFSRSGLIDQLKYEGFTTEDSVYAVDHVKVNWLEQAVRMAQSYLEYSAFSRSGLIDQLEYEGFTTEQAVYAVDTLGL